MIFTELVYKDLMEELYEFPLIMGLFMVAYPLMQWDCKKAKRAEQQRAEDDLSDVDSKISI